MKHLRITFNGISYEVDVEETGAVISPPQANSAVADKTQAQQSAPAAVSTTGSRVEAPMSGRIIRLCVKVGDRVTEDDPIAILEAMKLENEICSGYNGIVKEICVQANQIVNTEDLIAVIG